MKSETIALFAKSLEILSRDMLYSVKHPSLIQYLDTTDVCNLFIVIKNKLNNWGQVLKQCFRQQLSLSICCPCLFVHAANPAVCWCNIYVAAVSSRLGNWARRKRASRKKKKERFLSWQHSWIRSSTAREVVQEGTAANQARKPTILPLLKPLKALLPTDVFRAPS